MSNSKNYYPHIQKYDLNNLPPLDLKGWQLEQFFLRHIESGEIPNLGTYLQKLNYLDWNSLLTINPREEFMQYLPQNFLELMDWEHILKFSPELKEFCQKSGVTL